MDDSIWNFMNAMLCNDGWAAEEKASGGLSRGTPDLDKQSLRRHMKE